MSRIDDLIAELCPDGVEFKALGEVGRWFGGGTPSKQRQEFWLNGTIPWLSPKDMRQPIVDATEDYITPAAVSGSATKLVPRNSVAMVVRSSILDHTFPSAFVPIPITLNQDMKAVVAGPGVLPRFLAQVMRSRGPELLRGLRKSGGSVASLDYPGLLAYKVPVPPVALQREIAGILEKMERLQGELEAGLEAELELRSRQHASYRQVILDGVKADPVRLATLGRWQGGITPSKSNSAYWEVGTIPWLASMDVSDTTTDEIRGRVTERALEETSLKIVPAPSVAVVMRSNILRRTLPIGLIKVDTTVNQDMRALIPREGVDAEYVFQVLRADSERIRSACVRTDGSMAAMSSHRFFAWEIPLPPLVEQHSIADQLRSFDLLVNHLSAALPAEIAARRKQYEYYRDKLLTFEEKSA